MRKSNNFDDIGINNNDDSSSSGFGVYSFSSYVPFGVFGTETPENITVDVWTSSAWQNLFIDFTNGWNNITVSLYRTSSTFTIRFKGGLETTDTTQDSWNIDVTLLHVWES